MTTETLRYLNQELQNAGINYAFSRWNREIENPYWVGEYSDIDSMDEDGKNEITFILTGTTEGTWLELQNDKETTERLFRNKTLILDSGMGLSISYERALVIPTETETLKRMQIDISVYEWRNN